MAALALVALGVTACSNDSSDATVTTVAPGNTTTTTQYVTPLPMGDVVATALTNQVFTQLAGLAADSTLADGTGVVEALRGGPFTVFAPTDSAFDRLVFSGLGELITPVGSTTGEYERMAASAQLLRNVQKVKDVANGVDLVRDVLLHHVVAGAIGPDQMVEGELTTLLGDTLTITKTGEQWFVDGLPMGAGVEATNGWVYIMNDVLVPGSLGNVVEVATVLNGSDDDVVRPFGTLIGAVVAAGLADALSADSDAGITVFAPIESAFTPAVVNAISGNLASALKHHVTAKAYTVQDLYALDGQTVPDLNGDALRISVKDGEIYVNDVQLQVRNVPTTNGIVYVIAEPLGA